jgi:hypothetical protein
MNLKAKSPIPTPTPAPTLSTTAPIPPPTPTRRSALRGIVAAAVGLVAAPRLSAAAVPSRTPDLSDYEGDGDEKLTPAQRRQKGFCQSAILAVFFEIQDALEGIMEAREDDDEEMFDRDVEGILTQVDDYANLLEGDTMPDDVRLAETKRDQRRLAFEDGSDDCHGCRVLRGLRALEAAETVLVGVADRLEQAGDAKTTWLGRDAALWAWSIRLFRDAYEATCRRFYNDAATLADIAAIKAKYGHPKRATPTPACILPLA